MPIDPIIGGAVINVLGGLFGKKPKTLSPGDSFQSHIGGLMLAAEQHKINPLALLGVSPLGAQTINPGDTRMGDAISRAGMLLADGLEARQARERELAEENRRLNEKLNKVTLTPPLPGVYGGGGTQGTRQAGEPLQRSGGMPFNMTPAEDPYTSGINGNLPRGSTGINVGPFGSVGGVVKPGATELEQTYVGPNGTVMNVYEGPDADELVTGLAMKKWFDWNDPMMDRAQQGRDFSFDATVTQAMVEKGRAAYDARQSRKQAIIEEYIFQVDPSYVLRESPKDKNWAKKWPGQLPVFD